MLEHQLTEQGQGLFVIEAVRRGRGTRNLTVFRGAPTIIGSLSYSDPFSDATASLTFPAVTPFDDPESDELWWLKPWTEYTVLWLPCSTSQTSSHDFAVHGGLWANHNDRRIMWQGFSVSYEPSDTGASIQLQGALFYLDRFLAKPKHPPRPIAMEWLIDDAFRWDTYPYTDLRQLRIDWPVGWSKQFLVREATHLTPMGVKYGGSWSGYATRSTGSWNRLLTGHIQELLGTMYTTDDCGVEPGDQWTLRKVGDKQPVLTVRSRSRPHDFTLQYGTPGSVVRLKRDEVNVVNIVYGQGTGLDGTAWTNSVISSDGLSTSYKPLAADGRVYPRRLDPDVYAGETVMRFGEGIGQAEGAAAAMKILNRDSDPGWTGDITLKASPDPAIELWDIRPGMVVLLKGLAGRTEGIRLHIAEVTLNVQSHEVSMRVDSRFRDLLTLEEVEARVRDPLTPTKLLQLNRRSGILEDAVAPWDYSAGSGFIPRKSVGFHKRRRASDVFPWQFVAPDHPPSKFPEYYVEIPADATTSRARWRMNVPILMAQKGTIRRTEMALFDADGNRLALPFHASFYYYYEPSLPYSGENDGANYSPFMPNHFYSTAPNGQPWGPGDCYSPDPSLIIGWGNYDERAGYSPRRFSLGGQPTGMLIDESPWSFDMTSNPDWNANYDPGYTQSIDARTIWGCFYAEHTEPVYLLARLYRQEPGVG